MKREFTFIIITAGLISISIAAILFFPSDSEGANIRVINDDDYYPAVKDAFEEAKESIDIAMYGAKYYTGNSREDNYQVNSLIEELGSAVERGVKVRVIFDESWENIVDVALYLRSLGVDAVFDSEDTTTHAKLIVIDNKIVIVGSTNWSYHALQKNHEANVLIKSEELASQYEDYFEEIWDEQ